MATDYLGLYGPSMGGFFAQEDANVAARSKRLQDQVVQQGLLSKLKQEQEAKQAQQTIMNSQSAEDAISKLQRLGTSSAMSIADKLSLQLQHKAQTANFGVTGDLHKAQALEADQSRQIKVQQLSDMQNQGIAKQGLMQQLTQSQYGGATAPGGPAPQLYSNDAEAISSMKQAEASGQPFRGDVNNPNVTKALAVGAGPSGTEILRQMRPGGAGGMSEYQQENLRLQQDRLNKPKEYKPDTLVPVPDPTDPTKAVYGQRQAGQPAFAPGAGGLLNNNTIRERQISNQLETSVKPHTDVMNAYQRYNEVRGTGDNSQANQMLAQQIMQMSKTGQRVIPKAELERILGSGELGNNWMGRASNMISQMAYGVRTTDIDNKLNAVADAMAKASADRIGQEIQNARARTPSGANPDNIVGNKPRIYGRFIITPSGRVHTFASSAEAQAKLQSAAQQVGQ